VSSGHAIFIRLEIRRTRFTVPSQFAGPTLKFKPAHEGLQREAIPLQCAAIKVADRPTKIMDPIEETLVLVKPDALERGQTGEILRRFENAGLRIRNARWVCPDLGLVQKHYADLKTRNPGAYDRNTRYLAGKNALALVLSGVNAIAKV